MINKSELQKEILNTLKLKPHGRLLLAPRVGKTKLVIDIIKKNNPKSILWVTPSSKLAKEDIPNEFNLWKGKRYLNKLTTITYASLNKITGYYEMIVLDEETHITENNIINFFNKTITYSYICSMTGTPTKHDDKKELYKKLNLKVLYELSIDYAVNIGLLANYSIKVIKVNMSNIKNLKAGNKKVQFMTSEKLQYEWLTNNISKSINSNDSTLKFKILNRVRAIKNSNSKLKVAINLLKKLTGRILIFSSTINQAEKLCKHTYHSKTDDKNLNDFQNGKINRISMVNAGGTGFTYKKIDHLVVTQVDSDKNGLVSQKICRTLLKQQNYNSTIWIISLNNTQDEKWVTSALSKFNENKIKYINYRNNEN